MRLIHMACGSQPDISRCVDDFGVERAHNFAASHDNGYDGTFQVSIHYLDGFSDPDFFEHVWGKNEAKPLRNPRTMREAWGEDARLNDKENTVGDWIVALCIGALIGLMLGLGVR